MIGNRRSDNISSFIFYFKVISFDKVNKSGTLTLIVSPEKRFPLEYQNPNEPEHHHKYQNLFSDFPNHQSVHVRYKFISIVSSKYIEVVNKLIPTKHINKLRTINNLNDLFFAFMNISFLFSLIIVSLHLRANV